MAAYNFLIQQLHLFLKVYGAFTYFIDIDLICYSHLFHILTFTVIKNITNTSSMTPDYIKLSPLVFCRLTDNIRGELR